MSYFNNFPIVKYNYPDGSVMDSTFIFTRPDITLVDRDGYNIEGVQYVIEDGKSPDNVSKEIYGDSSLFWIILLQNNIIDFYNEWPIMYNDWLQQLSIINSNYSFFTNFIMDIQKNDIIVKYRADIATLFEEDNYGIITEYDPFFRRFDVKMTKGEINQNDPYMILRKENNTFKIIKTPDNRTYQNLAKKVSKLDCPVSFEKIDENTDNKIPISPYYSVTDETLLSDQTSDISTLPTSVLDLYIKSKLNSYTNINAITLRQQKEKEFIFTRKIKTTPSTLISRVNRKYLEAVTKESGII